MRIDDLGYPYFWKHPCMDYLPYMISVKKWPYEPGQM